MPSESERNGWSASGSLLLTERERVAVETLVDALRRSLERRLPLDLVVVDLELELARRSDLVALARAGLLDDELRRRIRAGHESPARARLGRA